MATRMNRTLEGVNHKAVIHGVKEVCACGRVLHDGRTKFFLTLNFENEKPREMFFHMDASGSTLDGMANCIGILISMLLKKGATLEELAEHLAWQRFNPQGLTENTEAGLRTCNSVVDYAIRWAMCEEKGRGKRGDGTEGTEGTDGTKSEAK